MCFMTALCLRTFAVVSSRSTFIWMSNNIDMDQSPRQWEKYPGNWIHRGHATAHIIRLPLDEAKMTEVIYCKENYVSVASAKVTHKAMCYRSNSVICCTPLVGNKQMHYDVMLLYQTLFLRWATRIFDNSNYDCKCVTCMSSLHSYARMTEGINRQEGRGRMW